MSEQVFAGIESLVVRGRIGLPGTGHDAGQPEDLGAVFPWPGHGGGGRPDCPFRRGVAFPARRVVRSMRQWLVGFAAQESNLEEVVARIARDLPEAVVLLEVTDSMRAAFETRVAQLRERLPQGGGVQLEVHGLPASADGIIANFVVNHLSIFYNDPARSEELESISCLAMTVERAVAFTRAGPFPDFLDGGTYVEDLAISDIIGMAAQIRLCHDFGEWQCYARIGRLLTEKERA